MKKYLVYVMALSIIPGAILVYPSGVLAGSSNDSDNGLSYQSTSTSDSTSEVGGISSSTTPLNISSVNTLPDIDVATGTPLDSVGLPAMAGVALSDSSSTTLPVAWDGGNPTYDENATGTYAFTGTLTLPSTITNTGNLATNVNVVVGSGTSTSTSTSSSITSNSATTSGTLNISSINPVPDVSVANGTDMSLLGLPSTVGVTLSDGSTADYNVTWNLGEPTYDPNTAGTYQFMGVVSPPSNVSNSNNLTVTTNVTVGDPPVFMSTGGNGGGGSGITTTVNSSGSDAGQVLGTSTSATDPQIGIRQQLLSLLNQLLQLLQTYKGMNH